MQLPFKIDYLLKSGRVESERLEFKAGWNPLKVMHKFETNRERSFFTVTFPVHPKAKIVKATAEDIAQVGEQVGEQVVRILVFCETPKTKKDILTHIGLRPVYLNYTRHIRPLVNSGLLGMAFYASSLVYELAMSMCNPKHFEPANIKWISAGGFSIVAAVVMSLGFWLRTGLSVTRCIYWGIAALCVPPATGVMFWILKRFLPITA